MRSPLDLGGYPPAAQASLPGKRAGLGEPEILRANNASLPNSRMILGLRYDADHYRNLCSSDLAPNALSNVLFFLSPQQLHKMASKRPAPSNDEESPLVDDPAEDATSPKTAREELESKCLSKLVSHLRFWQ